MSTDLNLSLSHLEHGRGLLLAAVGQIVPVHGDDLVALDEAAVGVGGAALHHFRDEHARPGLLADDGEAEALVLLLVELHLDGLVDLVVLAVNNEAHAVRSLAERVEGERVCHCPEVFVHHFQYLRRKHTTRNES